MAAPDATERSTPQQESQALAGRRIAITRAADQAGPLASRLALLGADVVQVPVIAMAEPSDGGRAATDAVANLADYAWVVLTSPTAARRFVDLLAHRTTARVGADPAIAAVGPGTAQVLVDAGIAVALVPDAAIGEGVVEAFPDASESNTKKRRVLVPRAEVARDVVPDGLAAKGWQVDVVPLYRTVPAVPDPTLLAEACGADAVVFTSSSTVTNFLRALTDVGEGSPVRPLPPIVSMGPATSATVVGAGHEVAVEADPHTLDGLLDAVVRLLG